MTRQAVLHTGEVMHFPDDTPDDAVHAQVRSRMGLPPPEPPTPEPDPVLVAHHNTQTMLAGAQDASNRQTQATAALHQQLGALIQSLQTSFAQLAASIAQVNAATAQAITHLSQVADAMHASTQHTHDAIDNLGTQLTAASDKMHQAITAPKKAVRNKDGSWQTV